jgi:hypothetical protein
MKWTSRSDKKIPKRANRSLPRTECDLVVAISTRHALNGGPIWIPCLFPRAGRLCRPARLGPLLFTSRGGPRKRALARACLLGPWRLGSCYKVLEKSKKKRARHLRQRAFLVRGTSSWSRVASLFVISSSCGGVGSRIALAG